MTKYQRWYDLETGEPRWLESLDGDEEEPAQEPTPDGPPPPTSTSDAAGIATAPLSVPADVLALATPAEEPPDPTPLWQKDTWHRPKMSAATGFRALAAVLRRQHEDDDATKAMRRRTDGHK